LLAYTQSDSFLLGKTDVIAGLLLHTSQNLFFRWFQVDQNGILELDLIDEYPHPLCFNSDRTACPLLSTNHSYPKELQSHNDIWIHFEEDCSCFRQTPADHSIRALEGLIRPSSNGPFGE
jgi:hypothetical protein